MVSTLVKTLIVVGLGGTALYVATRPEEAAGDAPAEGPGWGGGGGEMALGPPPGESMVDSDGDGVPDVYDVFPTDATRTGYEAMDTSRQDRDGDGVPDNMDVYPDAGGKTGYEVAKAGFWDGPVGNTLLWGTAIAGTSAVGAGAKAGWKAFRGAKTTKAVATASRKPIKLAPKVSKALTRLSGIKPATKATKLLPRVTRGAGRLAAPLVIAEGAYTGVRNLWDTGKAVKQGFQGDRDAARRSSSRAVQRGTQFLTLGSVNVNLRKQRVKVFGKKVAAW